jgi:hypothetical protein
MVVSPLLAESAAVDHSPHDTTSILATIEHRWNLEPLSTRDAAVVDLGTAFRAGLPRLRGDWRRNSAPGAEFRRQLGARRLTGSGR